MLLAPDGKIYFAGNVYTGYGIIHHPDSLGLACHVELDGLALPFDYSNPWFPYWPNYRLGALDGSPCDTLITATKVASPENISLHVWPNPIGDFIIADVTLRDFNNRHQAELVLLDNLGQVVRSHTLSPLRSTQHRFETAGLASGLYFVVVKYDGAAVKVEKLVRLE